MHGARHDRRPAAQPAGKPASTEARPRASAFAALEALREAARIREAAVASLYRADHSDAQIAAALDMLESAVAGIRKRLGLLIRPARRRYSRDEILALEAKIEAAVCQGKSDPQIADALGVTVRFVADARDRLDLIETRTPVRETCEVYEAALKASGGRFLDHPEAAARNAIREPLRDYQFRWFRRFPPGFRSSLG